MSNFKNYRRGSYFSIGLKGLQASLGREETLDFVDLTHM